jgi:hypothetical protein
VGGDYQGKNGDVPNAEKTAIGSNVSIDASALKAGDGGKVIVWANESTIFQGEISVRGGQENGSGGFAETSGKNLSALGRVDASAAHGASGEWLLDPLDIEILTFANPEQGRQVMLDTMEVDSKDGEQLFESSASGAQLDTRLITEGLQNANITITTGAGPGEGNITVKDAVRVDFPAAGRPSGTPAVLTLQARKNVNINAEISANDPQLLTVSVQAAPGSGGEYPATVVSEKVERIGAGMEVDGSVTFNNKNATVAGNTVFHGDVTAAGNLTLLGKDSTRLGGFRSGDDPKSRSSLVSVNVAGVLKADHGIVLDDAALAPGTTSFKLTAKKFDLPIGDSPVGIDANHQNLTLSQTEQLNLGIKKNDKIGVQDVKAEEDSWTIKDAHDLKVGSAGGIMLGSGGAKAEGTLEFATAVNSWVDTQIEANSINFDNLLTFSGVDGLTLKGDKVSFGKGLANSAAPVVNGGRLKFVGVSEVTIYQSLAIAGPFEGTGITTPKFIFKNNGLEVGIGNLAPKLRGEDENPFGRRFDSAVRSRTVSVVGGATKAYRATVVAARASGVAEGDRDAFSPGPSLLGLVRHAAEIEMLAKQNEQNAPLPIEADPKFVVPVAPESQNKPETPTAQNFRDSIRLNLASASAHQ